jgi:hypothetical protein
MRRSIYESNTPKSTNGDTSGSARKKHPHQHET